MTRYLPYNSGGVTVAPSHKTENHPARLLAASHNSKPAMRQPVRAGRWAARLARRGFPASLGSRAFRLAGRARAARVESRGDLALMRLRRNRMALVGLLATAAFCAGLLALHVANLGNMPSHMSQFANSPFGLFWALLVYTFILGSTMLIWALKPCMRDCPSKRIGLWMLCLAGLGAVLLATFPADEVYPVTVRGTIHDDAALTTFVLLGAAMVVLTPAFRASPSLARFAGVSLVLGLLVTASWIIYLVSTLQDHAVRGPVQRILVGLIVTWFVMLAFKLRKVADPPAQTPGQPLAPGRPPRARTSANRTHLGTHPGKKSANRGRAPAQVFVGSIRRKPASRAGY